MEVYTHNFENDMKTNRVVITGMGIYSCIGKNKEEVLESLKVGRSGIGIEPLRTEMGYRSPLTGILEVPNLKGQIDRRLRAGLAEEGIFAYVATEEALQQAKIDLDYLGRGFEGMYLKKLRSA